MREDESKDLYQGESSSLSIKVLRLRRQDDSSHSYCAAAPFGNPCCTQSISFCLPYCCASRDTRAWASAYALRNCSSLVGLCMAFSSSAHTRECCSRLRCCVRLRQIQHQTFAIPHRSSRLRVGLDQHVKQLMTQRTLQRACLLQHIGRLRLDGASASGRRHPSRLAGCVTKHCNCGIHLPLRYGGECQSGARLGLAHQTCNAMATSA